MSYLSKLEIDYETAGRKHLMDLYRWHQFSWELFPGRKEEKRDFLIRLDPSEKGFRLYILSKAEPHCPEWLNKENFAFKLVNEDFLKHSFYRFDIRANPTKKIKSFHSNGEEKKNGKRVALLIEKEQKEWLIKKAGHSGFEILENPGVVIEPPVQNFFKIWKKDFSGVHFGVRFTGLLKVRDQALFETAFQQGIGSAKSFGFGMLLIQPVKI